MRYTLGYRQGKASIFLLVSLLLNSVGIIILVKQHWSLTQKNLQFKQAQDKIVNLKISQKDWTVKKESLQHELQQIEQEHKDYKRKQEEIAEQWKKDQSRNLFLEEENKKNQLLLEDLKTSKMADKVTINRLKEEIEIFSKKNFLEKILRQKEVLAVEISELKQKMKQEHQAWEKKTQEWQQGEKIKQEKEMLEQKYKQLETKNIHLLQKARKAEVNQERLNNVQQKNKQLDKVVERLAARCAEYEKKDGSLVRYQQSVVEKYNQALNYLQQERDQKNSYKEYILIREIMYRRALYHMSNQVLILSELLEDQKLSLEQVDETKVQLEFLGKRIRSVLRSYGYKNQKISQYCQSLLGQSSFPRSVKSIQRGTLLSGSHPPIIKVRALRWDTTKNLAFLPLGTDDGVVNLDWLEVQYDNKIIGKAQIIFCEETVSACTYDNIKQPITQQEEFIWKSSLKPPSS